MFLSCSSISFAQWCGGAEINAGTISPTTAAQVSGPFSDNFYYTFIGQQGCEYTFETCGLSADDTFIRVYDATGATLLAQNDEGGTGCSPGSRITLLFNVTGTYTVHVSRFNFPFNSCADLNNPTSLRYSVNCTFNDNECYGATQICNDAPFSANTASPGSYQELNVANQGCLLDGENQSYWYFFQPVMNGTITFNINTCATCDYDFAIWATGNCGNLGAPIRCSFDATEGTTGLNASAADLSEGAGGVPANPSPKFVAPLNVIAGQTYMLLIDNYTANNEAFAIDFNFSTPGLLDCNPIILPVELLSFTGVHSNKGNLISWETASERENDHFNLYYSADGKEFDLLTTFKGAGNSVTTRYYEFLHENPEVGTGYYRLDQIDQNGAVNQEKIIAVVNQDDSYFESVYPNPSTDKLNFNYFVKSSDVTQMMITDVSGNKILFTELDANAKAYTTSLNVNKGIYFVQFFINGELKATQKWIKE